MGSAGKNPVTFGKLIYRQMKRQSRSIAVIFITVTIMGIFIWALTAEALSKITQAILDASTVNLIYSIIFLLILILINFLCTVLYRYNKFHLIKKITISFEEAYLGTQKEINIIRNEKCSMCHGDGAKPGTKKQTCSMCHGTGQIKQMQTYTDKQK